MRSWYRLGSEYRMRSEHGIKKADIKRITVRIGRVLLALAVILGITATASVATSGTDRVTRAAAAVMEEYGAADTGDEVTPAGEADHTEGTQVVIPAASKSKAPTVKATNKTIYTTTSSYTIKFNNAADDAKYMFTSSDKKVATVSSKGKVKPVSAGKATITAKVTQGGKTYTFKVKITVKEPYLKFSEMPATELRMGESMSLEVQAYGFTIDKIKWTSSNKDWASVSSSGKVTAKNAGEGRTVTITATDRTAGISVSTDITIPVENEVRVGEFLLKGAGVDPDVAELMLNLYTDNTNTFLGDGNGGMVVPLSSQNAVDKELREKSAKYSSFSLCVSGADCLRSYEDYLQNVIPSCEKIEFTKVGVYINALYLEVRTSLSGNYKQSDARICNAVLTGFHYNDLSDDEMTAAENALGLIEYANENYDNDYDKVKFFHDYLVMNCEYDQTYSRFTIADTLTDYRCVCDGYSKTFQLLCRGAGIDCYHVSGDTVGGGDGGHAWNKLCIDDEWYNVDVTWDDPLPDRGSDPDDISYAYFMVTDEDLAYNHIWDMDDYPEATSHKYCKILDDLEQQYEGVIRVMSDADAKNRVREQYLDGKTTITYLDIREDAIEVSNPRDVAFEVIYDEMGRGYGCTGKAVYGLTGQFYGMLVTITVK